MKLLTCTFLLVISSLGSLGQDPSSEYRIVIDKKEFSLVLFKGKEKVRQYAVCVGKNPGNKMKVGDTRTPEGEFTISKIQNSKGWMHDFKDGKGSIAGAYGPWFFRLLSVSGRSWEGIGIHGTHDPASIGTRASEGCVRLRNEELLELKNFVTVGTRVSILP